MQQKGIQKACKQSIADRKPRAGRNEKYYPLVFFVLFPLAGGCAAMEYQLFHANIGIGALLGLAVGAVCYFAWRRILSHDA